MPFLFVYVCDLLDKLERPRLRDVPLLPAHLDSYTKKTAIEWFQHHKNNLNAFGTNTGAVISMLRPENTNDREYGIDAETLELLIARTLKLSRQAYAKLQRWQRQPQLCDLGLCVSEVIGTVKGIAAPAKGNKVTVDEIDQRLLRIASFNPNSSAAVQSLSKNWSSADAIDLLGGIYCRLQGRDAKWLTRFILKDYGPVKVPDILEPESSHSGLPNCLNVSVHLFPSSAPVPMIQDGTMIIKGVGSTAPARPPPSSSRSPLISFARGVLTPRASRNARESSPFSNLVSFDKGILKPRRVANAARTSPISGPASSARGVSKLSADLNASLTSTISGPVPFERGLSKPSAQVPSLCSSSKSHVRSERSTPSLTGSFNNDTTNPPRCVLGSISSNTSNRTQISPRLSEPLKLPKYQPSNPLLTAGSGCCLLTSSTCPLTRCMFLLAPCIRNSTRLLEDLLPWHGAQYITSLSSLASPYLPYRCPTTGKNYRKIVLVESHRRKETVEFLTKIEELELRTRVKHRKRDGKGRKWDKEWVEVYDWRLLECIAKEDRGKNLTYNAWKRCFLCVV